MLARKNIPVPIEVSARHVHLSKNDMEALFGVGHELAKEKQLTQPSDFACKETVSIKFGSKKIDGVRVVGPLRSQSQVEISFTDAVGSGVVPPIRISGDISGSLGVALTGPLGEVKLKEGLIIAQRHLHCATAEAYKLGLENGDMVGVKIKGERPVMFESVVVRVGDNFKLCLNLDTDEGNSAGINKIGEGFLIK